MTQARLEINKTGWLSQGAEIHPSPNFTARPAGVEINLLVIHCISLLPDEFTSQDVIAFFQNRLDCSANPYYQSLKGVKVSAHFYISREGEIIQFVSVYDRAWHAGVSSFMEVENCNNYSVGIEVAGCDTLPYTKAQYQSLVELTRLLQSVFPAITQARITSHAEIALPKGRKTDPGPAFDWECYLQGCE